VVVAAGCCTELRVQPPRQEQRTHVCRCHGRRVPRGPRHPCSTSTHTLAITMWQGQQRSTGVERTLSEWLVQIQACIGSRLQPWQPGSGPSAWRACAMACSNHATRVQFFLCFHAFLFLSRRAAHPRRWPSPSAAVVLALPPWPSALPPPVEVTVLEPTSYATPSAAAGEG
jgi:hypothetical protein